MKNPGVNYPPSVTSETVLSWNPCEEYDSARIDALFAGRPVLTAADIATLDIPSADCIWALLHEPFLTHKQMRGLACDFAERVVHLCGDDPRPQAAIDAKRARLRGEITGNELTAAGSAAWAAAWAAARDAAGAAAGAAAWAAARAAARAAAWAAAWAAARAAAWAAAWAAAGDAAGAAAEAAEQQWQIGRILAVIEKTAEEASQ
jgi:hypothetical protein